MYTYSLKQINRTVDDTDKAQRLQLFRPHLNLPN
ncbi:hypothetical protein [Bacillus sp. ISL-18]